MYTGTRTVGDSWNKAASVGQNMRWLQGCGRLHYASSLLCTCSGTVQVAARESARESSLQISKHAVNKVASGSQRAVCSWFLFALWGLQLTHIKHLSRNTNSQAAQLPDRLPIPYQTNNVYT